MEVETHALDVAVRVVLTTGFGVESVLVAGEAASVEAKLVCIGNETIISCQLLSRSLGRNVRYRLRALAVAIDDIDIIHLEQGRLDVDCGTQIQRSRLGRGNGMGDSDHIVLVRTRVGRLAVHGQFPRIRDRELLVVRAGSNVDAGIGGGRAKSCQRSADGRVCARRADSEAP